MAWSTGESSQPPPFLAIYFSRHVRESRPPGHASDDAADRATTRWCAARMGTVTWTGYA